ncbi:unnamed protein product [Camellia sinensis]
MMMILTWYGINISLVDTLVVMHVHFISWFVLRKLKRLMGLLGTPSMLANPSFEEAIEHAASCHPSISQVEEKRRPLPNYMEKVQNNINQTMRDILLDWLVKVAEEYKLVSDTLYLILSYIDRFLSHHANFHQDFSRELQ